MLSIVDIKRELGKNIYIYPLNISSIKSNSIDLHASKFAWSVTTKKSLYNGNDNIVIPAHDTALIYSQEAIYVSNKIGGSYHSKVRHVSKGLGHIGTTLDAQYIGLSVVAFHNITDNEIRIAVGEEFVTIVFHYLHSDDYIDTISHDNPPGHTSLISGYEGYSDFQSWEESNRWCRSQADLYRTMIESQEYTKCKQQFKTEQIQFNRKFRKKTIIKYILIICAWLVVYTLLAIPAYFVKIKGVSDLSSAAITEFAFPALIAILIPNIILDYKK